MSGQPLSTRAAQNAARRMFGDETKLVIHDRHAYIERPGADVVERWKLTDETLRTLARIDEGYEVGPEGFTLELVASDEPMPDDS